MNTLSIMAIIGLCLVYLCKSIDFSFVLGRLFVLLGRQKLTDRGINLLASIYSVGVNSWSYNHAKRKLTVRVTSLDSTEYGLTDRFVCAIQKSGMASHVLVISKRGKFIRRYIISSKSKHAEVNRFEGGMLAC